jgi:transposase
MVAEPVMGIDVSKAWLDVAVLPAGTHDRVPNDAAGWDELCQQVLAQAPTRIVLEASGGYEAGVVLALTAAGTTPVVANPLTVRYFARSQGRKAKTDRVDALVLAQFGAERRPEPTPLPTAGEREVKALLARRRQLTRLLVMEKTRQRRASTPAVQASLAATITFLEAQRTALDAAVAAVVARDPDLTARVAQLQTVPGLGAYGATTVAVEVPELGACTRRQLCALLGVAPFAWESGHRVHPRRISGGRGAVRQLLYEAILTTIRCDATFAAYYWQLRHAEQPKPVKVARIACIRKLLGILTAMRRDGLTWQETAIGQGQFLAPAA